MNNQRILTDDQIQGHWNAYFQKDETIRGILHALDTDRATYEAPFRRIQSSSLELAEALLEDPRRVLRLGQVQLLKVPRCQEFPIKLRLSVKDLPRSARRRINELRAEDLGHLISVEGFVKKVREVRPILLEGAFECKACGNHVHVIQDDDFVEEPVQCDNCERQTSWRVKEALSKYIDHQLVEIQEISESVDAGKQPERLIVNFRERSVNSVMAGDRVIVNGVLVTVNNRKNMKKKVEFGKALEACSVNHQEQRFQEVDIIPADIEEIKRIAEVDALPILLNSFASTVVGYEQEKLALMMSLFGGVRRLNPDGYYERGDIHTLLVGDPGVAKSKLIKYLEKVAPRVVKTTGAGSSKAGLTVAAVQDSFGDGGWALEAGALPQADGALCTIDELDKMSKADQGAMHQAMEQQEVTANKAGLSATLHTRCAVVAAANPKLGRFDEYEVLHGQIDMPPALMSRFDFIFVMLDKASKERDEAIVDHILMNRSGAAKKASVVPVELFRKYVAFARREVEPVCNEEALALIRERYLQVRGSSEGGIAVTARYVEGLIRAVEAVAKIRLHEVATRGDAETALRAHQVAMESSGRDPETGKFDVDVIATGVSHSHQDRIRTVQEIVREKAKKSEKGYSEEEDIIEAAGLRGIVEVEARKALETLRRNNSVFAKGGSGTVAPL